MDCRIGNLIELLFLSFFHFYRETDIKSLIKNIKKDHKFLRKYINDVKDYIDIMEETLIAKKV